MVAIYTAGTALETFRGVRAEPSRDAMLPMAGAFSGFLLSRVAVHFTLGLTLSSTADLPQFPRIDHIQGGSRLKLSRVRAESFRLTAWWVQFPPPVLGPRPLMTRSEAFTSRGL